jgi:hypothetical protein
VYDMLTLDQMASLHTSLHISHGKLHDRLTGPARSIPFGPDWDIAHRAACDITDTMVELGAEIGLRLAERTAVDA